MLWKCNCWTLSIHILLEDWNYHRSKFCTRKSRKFLFKILLHYNLYNNYFLYLYNQEPSMNNHVTLWITTLLVSIVITSGCLHSVIICTDRHWQNNNWTGSHYLQRNFCLLAWFICCTWICWRIWCLWRTYIKYICAWWAHSIVLQTSRVFI